jgi:uncharacterized membrane protein YfhO
MSKDLRNWATKDIRIPHECLWGSFLIPVFLLGITLISWQVHPFGNMSPLTCDSFYQLSPLMAELRNKIGAGESLFYSWNIGGGTNFWATIGYYLGSPLNLLLIALPESLLQDGFTLLILLRTGLAGLFFAIFLRGRNGREDAISIALSSAYALCGYMMAYYWNMMWLDAVVLLPLVLLGLWRLFQGKKPTLFIIALSVTIFSNFYTGFFVCVFLVLFGPVLYLEAKGSPQPVIRPSIAAIRFSISSLIATAISSVMLFPVIQAISNTSAIADKLKIPSDGIMYFKLFDFGTRLFFNSAPMIRDRLPNIYCGVAILILVPLYGMCTQIRFRERLLSILLVLFFYFSMSSRIMDFLWNGMHFSNEAYFRQAFLLSFLLLYMASRVFEYRESIMKKKIFAISLGALIYVGMFSRLGEIQPSWKTVTGTIVFIIIYGMTLTAIFSGESKKVRIGRRVFLYAMILELFFATELAFQQIEKTEHFTMYSSYGQFVSEIRSDVTEREGDSFARSLILPEYTGNDGALYGIKSMSIFSSMSSQTYVAFMESLGIGSENINDVRDTGYTDVTAGVFGIRSTVRLTTADAPPEVLAKTYSDNQDEWPVFVGVKSDKSDPGTDVIYDGYEIVAREYYLPVGFVVPSEGTLSEISISDSPFENTNKLFENWGAEKPYLDGSAFMISGNNVKFVAEDGLYSFKNAGRAELVLEPDVFRAKSRVFLYIGTDQPATIETRLRNNETGKMTVKAIYTQGKEIIDCGDSAQYGEEYLSIRVIFESAEPDTFPIYCSTFDKDSLGETFESIGKGGIVISNYDSSGISGSLQAEKSGYLLFSVPFDKGWSIEIDGKMTVPRAAYGALLSVPIQSGSHEIRLRYIPPGFVSGLFISVIGVVAAALMLTINPGGLMGEDKKRRQSLEDSDTTPQQAEEE